MPVVQQALEHLRRLAEDILPGARASLSAPHEPPPGLAVRVLRANGDPVAWLALAADLPPADIAAARAALQRVADLAPQLAAFAGGTARREVLASVIGTMPVRAFMTDPDMRLIAVSASTALDLGQPAAQLPGQRLQDLVPHVFSRFPPAHERAMRGETLRTTRLEWRDLRGKTRWFRSEMTPWREMDGQIGGVMIIAVEITDVVEALETSRRAADRLNIATTIADIHIWEADFSTGDVVTAGAGDTFFDGLFDYEAMFRDPGITIHPEDRERVYGPWSQAVLNDTPFRAEYRINRADDREVWAASAVKLIRGDGGGAVRIVGAMQNITDRKRVEDELRHAVEAAEAANQAKSVFLATMSHEIRTPLNGVLGMAQAMAADDLSPTQRGRLRTIRHSGEALLTILNDLLDLSKIEAGKLELEIVDFELGHLAQGVVDAFSGTAARKGLRLALDVEPEARGRYRGDSTRLRQILLNLVSNALKFTEAGEVLLAVERRGGALAFSVADTGIGIPAERIPHLFDTFEQADVSTTRRFGGTGLGLAICRDLVSLMGGRIETFSREGAGSRFDVILELPRMGDETRREVAETADAAFEPSATLRVLAAEDNSVNQLVLRTLLQQAGLDPVIVEDGRAAVAAWRDQSWDVILMDVQMPVMDGPDATRAIRAEEEQSGRMRTPILALTANAMSHQVDEYLAAGMDGLIPKPIRVEELFAALQAVLNGAESADAAA